MTIRNKLIDERLAGRDPASVMRQDGLLGERKPVVLNRLIAAEFDHQMRRPAPPEKAATTATAPPASAS
jgi:hypothetical protein